MLALLFAGCGGDGSDGRRPDDALVNIDNAFQPLRRDFEGEVGKVRLVALVAPTCGHCLDGVQAIHDVLLPRIESEDVELLVIWTSILPTDVRIRALRLAEQYGDPRVTHYWEDSGRIARAFAASAGMESGRSIYNLYYLYGPDATWDPQGTMMDEPPDQNALIAGWEPTQPHQRMGDHPQVRLPAFDIDRWEAEIRGMLAAEREVGRPN